MSWKVPEISHEHYVRTLINVMIALDKTLKDLETDIIYVDNLFAPSLSTLSSPLQSFYVQMTTNRSMTPF